MKVNIHTAALILCLFICSCVENVGETGAKTVIDNDDTYSPERISHILDEQQRKIVDYNYSGACSETGMTYNSSQWKTILTTGASGMGIMNLIVGVERGWIAREDAADRIVKIVRFLKKADRFEGAWAHWYNAKGEIQPFGDQKMAGEIVETAFMMGGLLTACEYFTQDNTLEKEIRETTEQFWQEINWKHFVKDGLLYWIWHQDTNTYSLPLVAWQETLLVWILSMAAPESHAVTRDVYEKCWKRYSYSHPERKKYGYKLPLGGQDDGGPLFLAHYSFLGLNPSVMMDDDAFYWNQTAGHAMINRHYCLYEAPANHKYSRGDWGLTACAGCGNDKAYKQRCPKDDDGIIAPTAAISSYPYTPFYSTEVLLNLVNNYPDLSNRWGFGISYRPSDGTMEKHILAMEQAPMGIMIENYRSGLIWNLLMNNKYIKTGLQRAGISINRSHEPGFYLAIADTKTGRYDMMRHPDRGNYEIDFWSASTGRGTLVISSGEKTIYKKDIVLTAGGNTIPFMSDDILRGADYSLMIVDKTTSLSYMIDVTLR